MYLRGERIVGYTRVYSSEPLRPRMFMAKDEANAIAVAATLVKFARTPGDLVLPLHANSASTAAFGLAYGEAWDAGMALELAASPFEEYYARLQAGELPPGRSIWPVMFDLE